MTARTGLLSILVMMAFIFQGGSDAAYQSGKSKAKKRAADKKAQKSDSESSKKRGEDASIEKGDAATEAEDSEDHILLKAIRFAKASRKALEEVNDYSANFTKEELVGKKMISQSMKIKVREDPFSVYIYFEGKNRGREALFVDGQNSGKFFVHEAQGLASIVGTLSLKLDAPEVMKENRYPMDRIGMRNMVDAVIEQWTSETGFVEPAVKFFPNAKIGDRACEVVESRPKKKYKEFKFAITRLYIEKKSKLPIRVEQYGWPKSEEDKPELVELYMYSNIKPNLGFSARDFDRKNPAYNF